MLAAQVTDLDKLHSQQQTEGENKYSTIQKVTIRYRQTSNWCLDIKSISAVFRWNVDRPPPELHSLRSSSRSLRPSVGILERRRTDLGPAAPRSLPPKQVLFASSLQPIWPWNSQLWVALYPIQSFLPPSNWLHDRTHLQNWPKLFPDQTICGQIICKHLTGPQAHWIKGSRAKNQRNNAHISSDDKFDT